MVAKARVRVDVRTHQSGGMCGFRPVSKKGRRWVDRNVSHEGWQWLGGILWTDSTGYANDIADGMARDGLVVTSVGGQVLTREAS